MGARNTKAFAWGRKSSQPDRVATPGARLLSGQVQPALHHDVGHRDRLGRHLQRCTPLSPAPVWRLVGPAGRSSARHENAEGEPRSSDPDHRRLFGAESGPRGETRERGVAHPQCIRSAQRAVRPVRADRRAWRRATGPYRRGAGRDPPRRPCPLAAGPHCQCVGGRRRCGVRAAWKNARWQQRNGEPLDLLGMLGKCKTDRIDEPVWIGRRNGPTLALRLIAARKSEADAAEVAAGPAARRRRMATNCRRTRSQRPTGSFW